MEWTKNFRHISVTLIAAVITFVPALSLSTLHAADASRVFNNGTTLIVTGSQQASVDELCKSPTNNLFDLVIPNAIGAQCSSSEPYTWAV